MSEYLRTQIEKKEKEERKWEKITFIYFSLSTIAWMLFYFIVYKKEWFANLLNQENMPPKWILSFVPAISILAVCSIPFIRYAKNQLETIMLKGQLNELEAGEASK